MAPGIFVKPSAEPSPHRPSRFKSLSAFLNPFASATSSSPSFNSPYTVVSKTTASSIHTATSSATPPHKALTPSAPLPYHSAKTDISLTDLGHIALGGSPFRVYLRESPAAEGLPRSGLDTTPRHNDAATSGEAAGHPVAVAGLPLSRYPLAELTRSDFTPPGKTEPMTGDLRTTCREMPTLASAIHIADAPDGSIGNGKRVNRDQAGIIASTMSSSSIAGPAEPRPARRSKLVRKLSMGDARADAQRLPRSVSSTSSIFDAYRTRKTLRRSSSRSSIGADHTSAEAGSNNTAQNSTAMVGDIRPRRMSRRLSFDSIRHSFAGGSRRKDKDTELKAPVNLNESRRPGAATSTGASARSEEIAGRQHRLALPPMRSLRNKFSVGNTKSGSTMAVAKADVAARRRNVHLWDEVNAGKKGSATPATEASTSLGSAAGRGALRRMEEVTAHPRESAQRLNR